MGWIHHNKPWLGARVNRNHHLTKGLVGFWLMNEGSGSKVLDSSGNANTGTLTNSPTWVAGKFGPAIDFERGNSNYIVVPDSDVFSFANGRTVSYWIKPEAWNAGDQMEVVSQSFFNWYVGHNTGTGDLFFLSGGTGGGGGDDLNAAFANTDPPLGEWSHILWTFTVSGLDTIIEPWVNGVSQGTQTNVGNGILVNAAEDLFIGSRRATDEFFDGLIDHVAVWNRSFSVSEITQVSHNPFAMFRRDPIELQDSAAAGTTPKGPLGHPLHGPLGGPVAA